MRLLSGSKSLVLHLATPYYCMDMFPQVDGYFGTMTRYDSRRRKRTESRPSLILH